MKTEAELASYLINLRRDVLLAKELKNIDAEEIMQQLNHAILEKETLSKLKDSVPFYKLKTLICTCFYQQNNNDDHDNGTNIN
ncbi:hypothetical protein LSPH24S_02105 [Lysinibacillus sphaericus]